MSESSFSIDELACICAYSEESADWERLVHFCMPMASLVALRVSRMWMGSSSPEIVDDIVQEIFLKLCDQNRRILRKFTSRGDDSFMALLRVVSTSVANDYFRRVYSAKRGGQTVVAAITDDTVPEMQYRVSDARQMHQKVLFAQLDRRLRAAPKVIGERDRTIFWLYYRQGFTAQEIAGLPHFGLTAKGVESALRRIVLWLRSEIEPNPLPDGLSEACL
jgi:RNA polymerase sigma-70 factor (ECF subfamily)